MRWNCTLLTCSDEQTRSKPILRSACILLSAGRGISKLGLVLACTWITASAQGPGCATQPGVPSPAIGADVPATYFGPSPSTVQKELVGPLQLLTAGVLDQRAATRDVQHLDTTADRKQRQVGVGGEPGQFQLVGVAPRLGGLERRVRLCPVERRQHVVSAWKQNAIDLTDDVHRRIGRVIGQHHKAR